MERLKIQERPVKNDEVEVVFRQNARTSYNANKLSSLISYEDFVGLASISPTKLKKYLEKNPKIVPFVDDFSETNFTSAFLATRKIKQ